MALRGGGGSARLVRDVGTAGAVQGFRAGGELYGARLTTGLGATYPQRAGDGGAYLPPAASVSIDVSQVWLAVPQASGFTATANQTVGAFGTAATGDVLPIRDASANQAVGAFGTTATVDNGTAPEPQEPARKRGGGGWTRRIVVRIDDEAFIVSTPAEARALIAQAEALAEDAARAKAEELAAREQVRMRAARRAAPVVRIESPEPVPEIEAIREQVDAVNARIQALYVQALQTALIAREMQRRIEEDEEDAITALLA